MATILHLENAGVVVKVDPVLGWREQEERRIYVLPRVIEWLDAQLPELASNWNLEDTPIEQLDAFIARYCRGAELMFRRQFQPLRHISAGIWEFKTADLRLFGWFSSKDCFVCTRVDTAQRVKGHSLYGGYRDEAVRLRNELDLDEPKFIPGDDPNDVISAFSYPPP